MTQKRNTINHIDSTQLASNRKIEVAHLKRQEAVHVEYSGMSIYNTPRKTPYVFRSVPGYATCQCGSHDTYAIFSYLTLIYACCNTCHWQYCHTYNHSKTTRLLQYLIAQAYPSFAEALDAEMAEERERARLERNRRARNNRKHIYSR